MTTKRRVPPMIGLWLSFEDAQLLGHELGVLAQRAEAGSERQARLTCMRNRLWWARSEPVAQRPKGRAAGEGER